MCANNLPQSRFGEQSTQNISLANKLPQYRFANNLPLFEFLRASSKFYVKIKEGCSHYI